MANLGLFFPNRVDNATITGGSWLAALPVTNTGTRPIAQVSQSTNASTSSTILQYDLKASYALRAFALKNHNLSSAALWRIKLGSTSGASDLYLGSWTNVWQLSGYDATFAALGISDGEFLLNSFDAIQVMTSTISARYVTIEVDDNANSAGYIRIGRTLIAGGYIPTINASYGLKDGWRDFSTLSRTDRGTVWFNARRRIRNVSFVMENLAASEAVTVHEFMRILGTVGEVLYVPDTTDMAYSQRYGFTGLLRELSQLEYPFYNSRSLPVSIEEV